MGKTIFHTIAATAISIIIFIPITIITKFLLSLFFGSIFSYWEGNPGFGIGIIDFANDIYVTIFKFIADIVIALAMAVVPLYFSRLWLRHKLSQTNWIVSSICIFILIFSLVKYLPREYGANPSQLSDIMIFIWLALVVAFSHWLARKLVLES
jgi:hypothetical protein